MRQIINGEIYDTGIADFIVELYNEKFEWAQLYLKKNGEYFIAHYHAIYEDLDHIQPIEKRVAEYILDDMKDDFCSEP